MSTTVQTLEKIPRVARTPGEIKLWYGATAPAGWGFCTGGAVSRTDYPALFALLSTTYGAGDGSTTFNLPDLRNRVPIGSSAGKALHSMTGATEVTLAANQMPAWPVHSNYRADIINALVAGTTYYLAVNNGTTGAVGGPGSAAIWYTTAPTGSASIRSAPTPQAAVPLLPKNQALNFIIFLGA